MKRRGFLSYPNPTLTTLEEHVTISKQIISKEQNEKLNKMAKALRSDKMEVDNIFPAGDYRIPHNVQWDEVSALATFDHLDLDPLKELKDQLDEINGLLKSEYEKDHRARSDRYIKDLHTIKNRLLTTLLPYRYSRVQLAAIESTENTGVQIVLMADDSDEV